MECHLCGERAVGACRACGRFYCGQHGGPRWNGVSCDPCYTRSIALGCGAVAVLAVFAAVVFLTLASG